MSIRITPHPCDNHANGNEIASKNGTKLLPPATPSRNHSRRRKILARYFELYSVFFLSLFHSVRDFTLERYKKKKTPYLVLLNRALINLRNILNSHFKYFYRFFLISQRLPELFLTLLYFSFSCNYNIKSQI